jgi:hypothetical protein
MLVFCLIDAYKYQQEYLIRLTNVSLLSTLGCLLGTMTTERPVEPRQRKAATPSTYL